MLQQKVSFLSLHKWAFMSFATGLLVIAVLVGQASAIGNLLGGSEPLSPELAFVPEVIDAGAGPTARPDTITVSFQIEEGYYLYRDKTSFKVESLQPLSNFSSIITETSLQLGEPIYPEALILEDDFFGKMAIFRDQVTIEIPYTTDSALKGGVLAVKYQGCADIGLCYPPTTVNIAFTLDTSTSHTIAPIILADSFLPLNSDQGSSELSSPVKKLQSDTNIFGDVGDQNELLPPELAYLPQILNANESEVSLRWLIEPGYYLYRNKLTFALENVPEATITNVSIDSGVDQYDDFFGNVKVLRETAEAQLSLATNARLSNIKNANLLIKYQGCADIGVCFPPSETKLPLNFSVSANTLTAFTSTTLIDSQSSAVEIPTDQSEQDRLFDLLDSSSIWLTIATFFGLGVLLAFTPCVLPMVPILSSLIVGQGEKLSTARAFQLSLVYVLVMASTYAIVGIIVGVSGYNVQAFLQNPWVLSFIAVLFVALSLSMFGFYELQMPTSVQQRLTQWSNKQGGGQVSSVAAMGFISTLIVGPCITAPLAGALIYIAKTGDAFIGGTALFALGLGMGAPLLLIGTSAGKLVPKAGAWMDAVKHFFGMIMLAMAIYMVSRFIPTVAAMTLFGILAIVSGIRFGATDSISNDSSQWQRVAKGVGLVILLYGVALLIGALSGVGSYTTPLRGIVSGSSSQAQTNQHGLAFAPVKSVEELQRIVSKASQDNRPVMLDFYADWCISCKEMEAFTFTDNSVQALLKNAVVIQADVTANDDLDKELLNEFDLFGPPGIIFWDKTGVELRAARVVGFMSARNFSAHLTKFIGGTRL
ncbi:MAG: thiol:disulfide interchange protein DsbD [Granulosicoccus sp.]|jgi:thiol:disulfide interchange protein DsbD